jgi:hypothetical protein
MELSKSPYPYLGIDVTKVDTSNWVRKKGKLMASNAQLTWPVCRAFARTMSTLTETERKAVLNVCNCPKIESESVGLGVIWKFHTKASDDRK